MTTHEHERVLNLLKGDRRWSRVNGYGFWQKGWLDGYRGRKFNPGYYDFRRIVPTNYSNWQTTNDPAEVEEYSLGYAVGQADREAADREADMTTHEHERVMGMLRGGRRWDRTNHWSLWQRGWVDGYYGREFHTGYYDANGSQSVKFVPTTDPAEVEEYRQGYRAGQANREKHDHT